MEQKLNEPQKKGMPLLAWMFWWGLAGLLLFGIYDDLRHPFGILSVNKTLFLIFFYLVLVLTAWLTISAHNAMRYQKGLWEPDETGAKEE